MLILQRKWGQRIVLLVAGREIWVELTKNKAGHTCFGVTADPDVKVYREEVYECDTPRKEQ